MAKTNKINYFIVTKIKLDCLTKI